MRAGTWFLRSGIQQPDGGVARYYRADQGRNLPVSTEITGYTVSTFVYLHTAAKDVVSEVPRRIATPLADGVPFGPGSDQSRDREGALFPKCASVFEKRGTKFHRFQAFAGWRMPDAED
jgi:hypothetical protein